MFGQQNLVLTNVAFRSPDRPARASAIPVRSSGARPVRDERHSLAAGLQSAHNSLVDALSETLRVVQLSGAIFINARFSAPWCYQSPRADFAAPLLEPGAERVVIFHLITEGECHVEMTDEPPVRLSAGDAVVFPQEIGRAHV